MKLTPNSHRRCKDTKEMHFIPSFALYFVVARFFLSHCHDVHCVGPYTPAAELSGLRSTWLEHPIAQERSADPHFLHLKQRRSMGRWVSPIAGTHLGQGPGMSALAQFAWVVVPTACYQHLQRQLGHVVIQPHRYSFIIRSNS